MRDSTSDFLEERFIWLDKLFLVLIFVISFADMGVDERNLPGGTRSGLLGPPFRAFPRWLKVVVTSR